MPRPWVIKDLQFIHTVDLWLPLFAEYEPTLVRLVRDEAEVAKSYRKRDERTRFDLSVRELFQLAKATFCEVAVGEGESGV